MHGSIYLLNTVDQSERVNTDALLHQCTLGSLNYQDKTAVAFLLKQSGASVLRTIKTFFTIRRPSSSAPFTIPYPPFTMMHAIDA